ncbi:hypothetical protein DERF_002168 [Dermatophagoides farinae]|uniref:Uncharacterized protein n=1 Tax=Dermatophagoides farinae TaxID=6954 RepID=A0A922LBS0_DERFA|nr:hypothetical protein DERF_002168 [Dermatophagoides farinae]
MNLPYLFPTSSFNFGDHKSLMQEKKHKYEEIDATEILKAQLLTTTTTTATAAAKTNKFRPT